MSPQLLALLTAFFFSLQTVFTRVGLRSTPATVGVIVASAVACLGLWLSAPLFGQLANPGLRAIGYFALGGIMSPALSWFLFFEGIVRVGMARAAPLSSIAPFLAAIGATAIFGERLTLPLAFGLMAVVIGVSMISFQRDGGTFKRRDLAFPLISALTFATSMLFRKAGLAEGAHPITGAAIGTTVGLAFLFIINRLSPTRGKIHVDRRDLHFLILAGLSITVAYALYFTALQTGDIVVVSPIINVKPLITLCIGVIFLRQYEQFSLLVITGSMITVFGVVLLTVF